MKPKKAPPMKPQKYASTKVPPMKPASRAKIARPAPAATASYRKALGKMSRDNLIGETEDALGDTKF